MKRHLWKVWAVVLTSALLVSLCVTWRTLHAAPEPTPPPADPLVEKAIGAMLAIQRYSWEQGVAAQALWEWGDTQQAVQMSYASLIYTTNDGRIATIPSGGGVTDPGMGGEALWRAGQVTGDAKLQKAADDLLNYYLTRSPRAPDGTLYHTGGPEVWVDSFYCVPPYFAVRGKYDEALKQVDAFRTRLWNPDKKLFSHMWNENQKAIVWKDYWGVGNGWAAMGMTRVVEALPDARDTERKRVASYVKELIDGCLVYQRADGLFTNVVDKPDTFVETNLAQMLAYSIYTGVASGWLPAANYIPAADKMRQAARGKVDAYGFVQGVCGAPDFGHAGIAAEGQAGFILMEAAYRKYQQSTVKAGALPKLDEVVKLELPAEGYSFTLAEVAKGITIPYTITVAQDYPGVIVQQYTPSANDQPGPSGLMPHTSISGNGQRYDLLDFGLRVPRAEVATTIKKGTYECAFAWDGRNWAGPSDTMNPKGAPFPAGTYDVKVTIRGKVGTTPYEITQTTKLVLK
jgi:unsaturated rhamnogalacturonyl hydrolase